MFKITTFDKYILTMYALKLDVSLKTLSFSDREKHTCIKNATSVYHYNISIITSQFRVYFSFIPNLQK